MRILWDEPKRLPNLDKHQLDFRDLTLEFFAGATIFPTHRRRLAAIGRLADRTFTVIFRNGGRGAVHHFEAPGQPEGKDPVQ